VTYEPDVFDRTCAARRALDLIADKWTVLVLYALAPGPRRHMELRRAVDGITQKMLTQTLRKLEAGGLVDRTTFAETPPRVEYRLTMLGLSLLQPLSALCAWAEEHAEAIEQATPVRDTYARSFDYDAVAALWARDAERMASALHRELVKRTPGGDGEVATLTAAQMVDYTAGGGGTDTPSGGRPIEIAVHGVEGDIAAATVTSAAFLDYLHLVRTPSGWQIVNALWRAR
jgi:DNA-binding HxlR family transcriptional regulator